MLHLLLSSTFLGDFHISTSDTAILTHCGQHPYLGVYVDSGEAVEEVDEINNVGWIRIQLVCPDATGFVL